MPLLHEPCRQLTIAALGTLGDVVSWSDTQVGSDTNCWVWELVVDGRVLDGTLPETNIHLKMDGWNASFLLGRPIFRGYVSFRECIYLHELR